MEMEYVDYVFSNKSYFLISWKCRFAYKLSINPSYTCYFKDIGSAYLFIAGDAEELEVRFSNVWSSTAIRVTLTKASIEPDFEYELKPDFRQWRSVVSTLSCPAIQPSSVAVKHIHSKPQIPSISLQNLTFQKPN